MIQNILTNLTIILALIGLGLLAVLIMFYAQKKSELKIGVTPLLAGILFMLVLAIVYTLTGEI